MLGDAAHLVVGMLGSPCNGEPQELPFPLHQLQGMDPSHPATKELTMLPYAMWNGTPKRAWWSAVIKDTDHGKILWSGTTPHPTLREALAEAEAQRLKLLKEKP